MYKLLVRNTKLMLLGVVVLTLLASTLYISAFHFIGRGMGVIAERLTADLVNRVEGWAIVWELLLNILYALSSFVSLSLVYFLVMFVWQRIELKWRITLSEELLQRLNEGDFVEVNKKYDSQKLFSLIYNDVDRFVRTLSSQYSSFLSALLSIIVSLIYISSANIFVTILVLVATSLIQLLQFLFKRTMQKGELTLSSSKEKETILLTEYLGAFSTHALKGRDVLLREKTIGASIKKILAEASLAKMGNLKNFAVNTLQDISLSLFLFFIPLLLLLGYNSPSISTFLSITMVLSGVYSYFNSFFSSIISLLSIREIKEKLDIKIEKYMTKKRGISDFQLLEIKELSYRLKDKILFENLNLTIKAGGFYGIVGASGSGKTTLLKIILGVEQNYEGSVKINGIDYKEIDLSSLRSLVAYCPVDIHIFSASVEENITLGEGGEIEKELDSVKLNEEVNSSSNALELSIGQQQRVAVARTLFLKRSVVILDESLANLDKENRRYIKKRLSQLEATVILVSHHIDKNDKFFDQIIDLNSISKSQNN